MIGTVRQVLPGRAWVELISDSQSNVNIVIQESRAQAILRGSIDKRLSLQFVAASVDVKVGDTVLTSGLGSGYPAGLRGEAIPLVARICSAGDVSAPPRDRRASAAIVRMSCRRLSP